MPERYLATGSLIVSAGINGRPAKLLIDTGITANYIHRDAAEDFGLNVLVPSGTAIGADGAESSVFESYSNILIIGEREFKVTFRVMDLSHLVAAFALKDIIVNGIIGAHYMIQPGAVIDLVSG